MDSASTIVTLTGRGGSGPPLRLLAETVVAVQYTLGTGTDADNLELDALERSVWLELRLRCPDRGEREHLIENARAAVAPPGAPSCRRAARLLIEAGGWLLRAAERLAVEERSRTDGCAEQCARWGVRLERIALEAMGAER
jgi:hypothetical protein